MIHMDTTRITLSHIIPDLLFADLPPEMLIRTKISPPEHYLMSLEDRFFGGVAPPPPEATGMFVQPYYSFTHADVFLRKPAGALKAVCTPTTTLSSLIMSRCVLVLPAVVSG